MPWLHARVHTLREADTPYGVGRAVAAELREWVDDNPSTSDEEGVRVVRGATGFVGRVIIDDQDYEARDVPLWLHAGGGSLDDVREVLAKILEAGEGIGVEDGHHGMTPFMNAASEGQTSVLQVLLDAGADPTFVMRTTGNTSLIRASQWKPETVAFLLQLPEVAMTIDAQNKQGYSALSWASMQGCYGSVKLLLDRGANVETLTYIRGTALAHACSCGHLRIAKLLLAHGANPSHLMEDNVSIFYGAVDQDHDDTANQLAILELLFEAGADIEAPALDGNTPLHAAASMGYVTALRFLLSKNIKIGVRNIWQVTPLHNAVNQEQTESVHMI
ncbi:ankyrin repeat-containing domain protein, partial [Baffinella frigidus]